MKVVTLQQPGQFTFGEAAAPSDIAPGEALVRVRRVGVCGTDLHAYRGKQPFFSYPRILGHELGIEIVQVGRGGRNDLDDRRLEPGDRCAVEPYLNCGHCIACRNGKTNCCADLKVLGVHCDGGMRELIAVPIVKLHRSRTLTLEQLALVETLGIGAHAVDRCQVREGESVLVIGSGPIGLSVIQFARAAGAKVLVMDVNESRLRFCRQHLGVQETILAADDALERVRSLRAGDLPTAVFDATGNASSMMKAFDYVAPGGRLVFVGLVQGDVSFSDPHFHRREITLLATRNSTAADFTRIIRLIEAGQIDTTPWITHRAACDRVATDFAGWLTPEAGVIKAMVEF
jgi:2-desacetyl-2-hydroxyethyl bacteriochlorophyllide A dehydrogenase